MTIGKRGGILRGLCRALMTGAAFNGSFKNSLSQNLDLFIIRMCPLAIGKPNTIGYKPILLLSSIPLGTCLLGTVLQLDPVGERQVYRVPGSWLQDAEGQIKREYD